MPFVTDDDLLRLNKKQFDFNVQFEQLFFSIIPAALFITISPWRVFNQARKPILVDAPMFQLIKAGTIAIYAFLELSLLVLAAVGAFRVTKLFIAAAALNLVLALFMATLSVIEHSRSPQPSALLSLYLGFTLLLDTAQARTLFLLANKRLETVYSGLFCAAVAVKAVVLFLEAKPKARWIKWDRKEHSPEEMSNIFSLGVFYWLNDLFRLGYGKIMTIEDLYPLDYAFQSELLHEKFSRNINYENLKSDKYGLVKVLVRTMISQLLLPIPTRLAMLGFQFCQPFFIESLLRYLAEKDPDPNFGYGYIGAAFFIYTGIAVSTAYYWYLHNRARTMVRSILVVEIYNRATQDRIGNSDHSAALTLMSADMERIRLGFRSLHEIWACFLQAAIAGWMLYIRLGIVFIAPIGLVIVCFAVLTVLMSFAGDTQRAWMAGVQERVGLTATVISSMKTLKMAGLSSVVGDYVQKLRVKELAAGALYRKIFIIAAILGFIPYLIGPPITFASAYAQSNLDASTIFSSLSFITLLTYPLEQVFEAFPKLISGIACIGRIQAFIQRDPRHDYRQPLHSHTNRATEKDILEGTSKDLVMVVENGNFGWEEGKHVLKNMNVEITRASLTLVVGPIGSGKSTFCKALLGEIPSCEGTVACRTDFSHIGFCEQTAFLSNGSIRDNIVGFCQFDNERYLEVVNATALDIDFAILKQGDLTNIGSDGITLSGGQRQRVALARALYLPSDMLILDDIFSGLDANTEERVFKQVFGLNGITRRRQTTVVLCTHSIRHLPVADQIIALQNETVEEQGGFEHLMARPGYVQNLGLKIKSKNEETEASEEATELGAVSQPEISSTPDLLLSTEESRKNGDGTVYKHYAKSIGFFLSVCSLVCASFWGFFTNFPTVWLSYWTNNVSSSSPSHGNAYYAGIYAFLNVCALISLLLLGIVLLLFAVKRAGAHLHQETLNSLLHAPLSFLTNTDTGVIINLFSQDLNLIDTELPDSLLNTLFCISQAIGQAAVMLTSSAYLGIAYPILALLLYVLGRFYLRTSRQLRLLDLESKSPLYTHFIDTLKGIVTLRASGFITENIRKNAFQTDTSQRPAYLLLMIQEWLNLVLGIVVMILAVVMVTLAVRLRSNSAFAGASLYSLITLGENLAGIVLYYTRLETCLGGISRLQQFSKAAGSEDKEEEENIPPEDWPQAGMVELNGVSASYNTDGGSDEEERLALVQLHLTIQPGEKLAICGRTGSGKSSLIALLLKLLDPTAETAHNVSIDDLPLHRIDRSTLRQQIIAVPQDFVFIPDTVQANLDPTNSATSEECDEVLKDIGLWEYVQKLGGLKSSMSAETFSSGQRQLISVGRALLRRRLRRASDGGILLLDEVSSSVDYGTERLVQEIIRSQFKNYTVVAVSHRLDMIMDFDRVVVMDSGSIVEIGVPTVLAAQKESRFGELVNSAM